MRSITTLCLALALVGAQGCARDRGETTTASRARPAASHDGARAGARDDEEVDGQDGDAESRRLRADARAEHDDVFEASASTTGADATTRGASPGGAESAAQPIAAPPSGDAPTASEQPMGTDDETITRLVRRSVVGDGSLSIMARNATIVTRSGVVTLRGTVARPEERSALERHAWSVRGVSRVDNRVAVRD